MQKGFTVSCLYYAPNVPFPSTVIMNKAEKAELKKIIKRLERLLGEEQVVQVTRSKATINFESIEKYFSQKVEAAHGFVPEISYSKDRRAIRHFLSRHSLTELKEIIDSYVGSDKAKRLGVSLSSAVSTHSINLWREGKLAARKRRII